MRVLITALLVCTALALCQAAVRRASHCTLAMDCSTSGASCEDATHHWSCINKNCECHSHGTSAPSTGNVPEGSSCTLQSQCPMEHCPASNEHCYDGKCHCSYISSEHHHHHDDN